MSGSDQRGLRGLSSDREISSDKLYRDIRTPMEVFGDTLANYPLIPQILAVLLILPVFASTTFFIVVCCPVIFWITSYPLNRRQTLPLLLPREAGITDENDPKPGRFGNHKARGDFFIGNQRFANKAWELWLSFAHLLQHSMILGSTGAGKTETLVSMVANYLAVGSGVMYSDAKAAPSLGWQIMTLARIFGREDDFRALNYIKGNTSEIKDPAVRRSNNVNLFTYGSAESITQIIVSIMPPGGAENKLFSERAIGLISAVMPALIDLRDRAGLLITPAVIRKSIELPEVEKLQKHPKITRQSREAIRAYLASLPGYKADPGKDRNGNTKKQPEEVGRQFGFAQAYFTRALASLSDTYGDIYMTGRGEINFLDMILRRRIGVVMVPALEKAPDEMKNLSKIVLAAQKNAISTGIPPDIEGRKEDVLDSLPITAPVPYGIINDEFAFMMTAGYGVTLAQARGLYVAITIAGQDYAGMKREDEDEAEQIAENTKFKIVMASEGLGATAELIKQIAGEGIAAAAQNYARNENSLSMAYTDSKSANFERRSRVDTMDTRSQVEGEGIIFWRDKIVPVAMFFHGIDKDSMTNQFTVPRLLDVDLPKRGYGARLVSEKSPYHRAMEQVLRLGNQVAKSDLEVPPALKFLTDAAKNVSHIPSGRFAPNELDRMIFGGALSELDADLSNELDDDSPLVNDSADDEVWVNPLAGQPGSEPEPVTQHSSSVKATTHQKSEHRSGPDNDPVATGDSQHDPWQEQVSEEDRQAAEEEAYLAQQYGDLDDPDEDAESAEDRKRRIAAELSGVDDSRAKNMMEGAIWTLDHTLLGQVTDRDFTGAESDIALQAANSAMRIEAATGTSREDAEKVGQATAGAVLDSINYPSKSAHIPRQPKNEKEKERLIERTTDLFSDWLNAADEQDDSMGQNT